jgi:hypothetical protein
MKDYLISFDRWGENNHLVKTILLKDEGYTVPEIRKEREQPTNNQTLRIPHKKVGSQV